MHSNRWYRLRKVIDETAGLSVCSAVKDFHIVRAHERVQLGRTRDDDDDDEKSGGIQLI